MLINSLSALRKTITCVSSIPSGKMIPIKDPVPIAINEEPQEALVINEEIAFSFKKIMTAFLAIHWRMKFPFKNFDYF